MLHSFVIIVNQIHNASNFLSIVQKFMFFLNFRSLNSTGKLSAYAGFDATGDSLHVGNLLVLIALLNWQRQGYKTIVLVRICVFAFNH